MNALYRCYDEMDRLLYVGISISSRKRLNQHLDTSDWFSLVAQVKIEKMPDRQTALLREQEAIRKEKPLYNYQHNRPPRPVQTRKDEARDRLLRQVTFKPTYTAPEAAEILSCSNDHIYTLIKQGRIGHFKISNRVVISGWAIIDFLEASERSSPWVDRQLTA
jgi:excisionase family DNA binding protein